MSYIAEKTYGCQDVPYWRDIYKGRFDLKFQNSTASWQPLHCIVPCFFVYGVFLVWGGVLEWEVCLVWVGVLCLVVFF